MTEPGGLQLDDDARRASRLVALDLLQRVREARPRLDDRKDAAALHDFRVAVRRLRTWLASQAPLLGDSAPRKVRRWLRRLAQATNPSRDAEVFAEWLASEREHLVKRHHAAAAWLERRVSYSKRRAASALRREVDRDLPRALALLDDRLPLYDTPHHVHSGSLSAPFGTEMAAFVRAEGVSLQRRLKAVRSADDADGIHRARIAGKRLRYLLEPVEQLLLEGPACVAQLKAAQDVLGDHHDAIVWLAIVRDASAHVPRVALRTGLGAVEARIRKRAAALYESLDTGWLTGEPPLFGLIKRVADDLAARGRRGLEIERKYLLDAKPTRIPKFLLEHIEQGYLPGERLIERVRRVRVGQVVRHLRTVKAGAGVARVEIEEECSPEVFAALWPLTEGRRVTKRRRLVKDGDLTWAVDEFRDRKLVLAEVELPSVETVAPPPAWLGRHVVREVTDDPAYVNAVLAR